MSKFDCLNLVVIAILLALIGFDVVPMVVGYVMLWGAGIGGTVGVLSYLLGLWLTHRSKAPSSLTPDEAERIRSGWEMDKWEQRITGKGDQ